MTPLQISIAALIILLLLMNIILNLKQKSGHQSQSFDDFTDRMDARLRESIDSQNLFREQFTNTQRAYETKSLETMLQNFQNSQKVITDMSTRLGKIDEAQRNIDGLSKNILSLQDILTDKKTRGIFGEIQLNQILSAVFGDRNDDLYQLQYSVGTRRVDAALFLPQPLGTLPIDSKFPLENYQRMHDHNLSPSESLQAEKAFIQDCKVHIDAIATKYIIPDLNIHQAMMFIPAEAIFASITAKYPEIINYGQSKNVWLVSPTTMMSTLSMIQMILKEIQQNQHMAVIKEHLEALANDFRLYEDRWNRLSKNIEQVNKCVKDITITTDKISKRFDTIHNVDIEAMDSQEF